ncbi:dUTP diphosphatase [bacterium]|nr:dUTP diphosphatase [bacterium]
MNIVLKFQKLDNRVQIPQYQTVGSSGMDLCAFIEEDIILKPMERKLIPTGLKMEIPIGYEAQVRPRSGLSIKNGITLINCIGTVDADYRGELKVPLVNLGQEDYTIKNGDRIAQMVIMPIIQPQIEVVTELSQTQRQEGGFGSTGV